MNPLTEKKTKESQDHGSVMSYLQVQRNKRIESKNRNYQGGYASQFSNYDEMKSNSMKSQHSQSNRPVADAGLRKLLNDQNISETDRIEAVRLRTEQIEKKAKMEEQKLRLIKPGENGSEFDSIEQNIAVNDIYIDSIQAKLNILEKI